MQVHGNNEPLVSMTESIDHFVSIPPLFCKIVSDPSVLKQSIPSTYGLNNFFSQPGAVSSFWQDSLGTVFLHNTQECTSPIEPANLNLFAHKLLSNQHAHISRLYAYCNCERVNS